MAEVPREIMNHLRAQMYNDRHIDRTMTTTRRTNGEDQAFEDLGLEGAKPGSRIKKALSRLALGNTEPEPSGD